MENLIIFKRLTARQEQFLVTLKAVKKINKSPSLSELAVEMPPTRYGTQTTRGACQDFVRRIKRYGYIDRDDSGSVYITETGKNYLKKLRGAQTNPNGGIKC